MKVIRAKTKVRKSSGSVASTIPIGMAQLLGIEPGTKLVWELNPVTSKIEVFPETEQ